MTMTSQFADIFVGVFFFVFFFVKFSNWSKFRFSIITFSGVMIIYFYEGIDQKSGNRKYPRLSFAISEDRCKLGTDASNKMWLNTTKFQGYSIYCFWVIKGKPTGGRGGVKLPLPPPPPRLGLKLYHLEKTTSLLLFVNNWACKMTDNLWDIPPIYLFPFEKYILDNKMTVFKI